MSFRQAFSVAPERLSRRARVRWFVMRHWWWLRGWCSRDGRTVYMRLDDSHGAGESLPPIDRSGEMRSWP